ncbi:MAG: EamA family transporter [Bacteroidetes bacterium]|nr:EamA family transporter [Bacteroidota bacterium]
MFRASGSSVRGLIFVLLAAFFWGISGTAAQFLFSHQIEVMQVVQTRSSFAFVLFAASILLFRRESLRVTPPRLGLLALAGIIGIGFSNYTYYATISVSTVSTAIILQYTAPVLVMVYGILTRTESAGLTKWLALSISLSGCLLAVGTGGADLFSAGPAAIAIGTASAFCFAFMSIIGRRLNADPTSDLWGNLVYTIGFAALFWAVFQPPWQWSDWNLDTTAWLMLIGFSLISVLLPYLFFYLGLTFLPPTTVLIISTAEPVTAMISSWLILGESMSAFQITGASLVLLAILILGLDYRRRPPSQASQT